MTMPQVNGFAAFLGKGDLPNLVRQMLKSMAHRARAGFWISPRRTSVAMGGCLLRPAEVQDDTLLHGVIYHPSNFDLGLKAARRIGVGDLVGLASDLAGVDGAYAFAYPSDDGLIVGRDPLGVKPLYVARSSHVVGVASEAKALASAGLRNVVSVEPGRIYHIRLHTQEMYEVKIWRNVLQRRVGLEEASEKVSDLLADSVRRRISGRRRVCVGFSGGLDSSLIALIASEWVDVDLVTVCTPDSMDRVEAESKAKILGLPLTIQTVDKTLIQEILEGLPNLIESEKIMDLSIGLAMNLTAKKAWEMGYERLLLGQLADELFGGYARYVKLWREEGSTSVQKILLQDVLNAHRNNFERDDKAASPFVQLDLPYASVNLVDYVLQLPPALKINPSKDIRKVVLRRAAVKAGLPEEIAYRAKKAVQYSSGLQRMVKNVLVGHSV